MISATPGREVRQELYLNTQYEKARQDVGLFIVKIISENPYLVHFREIKHPKLCHLIAINQYVNANKYG